eukprot:CAMPEP_0115061106 /NCGR_PEP_ID=MMETSP0227-20121206/7824_1 /TAXON_ID=89957 /ORGANISM="Polarella glacialis, Strain CCMP 1383" /LENGTH=39 /DNA_ID= /DNA_START= /DNA_END= /DNA_ORIENTATION=
MAEAMVATTSTAMLHGHPSEMGEAFGAQPASSQLKDTQT